MIIPERFRKESYPESEKRVATSSSHSDNQITGYPAHDTPN